MEGQEIVFHEKQRRSEQGTRMQYLSCRSIVLDLPSDHQMGWDIPDGGL